MGSIVSRLFCCNRNICKHSTDSNSLSNGLTLPSSDSRFFNISGGNLEVSCEPKKYSWDTRPKINPEDYTISNLDSDQQVKLPGEINGQQMIIKNCVNSKIYLFDYSASITIDDCIDCLFVLGPVSGSIFLRDTKKSTLVCSASQLRLRDCQEINLFVGCESDPIIEASTEVTVAPNFLFYKEIEDHFQSANLSRFKSTRWAEIYDFTPNDSNPNWTLYDKERSPPAKYFCPPYPPQSFEDLQISFNEQQSFIPITQYIYKGHTSGLQNLMQHEVTFNVDQGQDVSKVEGLMEKFYRHKFTQLGNNNVLVDIKYTRNQYTFSYYSET